MASSRNNQITATAPSLSHIPKFDGTDWQAVYPEELHNPVRSWFIYDEFMAGNQSGSNNSVGGDKNWLFSKSGAAGSGDLDSALVSNNHPGVIKLMSAAGGGSYAAYSLGNILLGDGALTYEFLIHIPTLANVTNDYTIRVGLGDAPGADQVNGVYFEYTRGTSLNWLVKTASASTRTTTTTSVVVASGVWIRLTCVINSGSTSVGFFINGTSVGTITTNITTTVVMPFLMHQTRTAGTPPGFSIDYFKTWQRFTVERAT